MKNNYIKIISLVISVLILSGCGKKIETLGSVPDLSSVSLYRFFDKEVTNVAIVPTIGQAALLTSSELSKHAKVISKNIIVTSTVSVNDFRTSSDFGRLYSESMMTNFKRLGWNVIDFRGKNLLVQPKNGEFYLDRSKLKDVPKDSVIFVSTYGEYQNGLLLNMRMLDSETNKVITASNVQLDDENSLLLSKRSNCIDLTCISKKQQQEEVFTIGMNQDDCSNSNRCECTNPDSCLGEECSNKCKRK